MGKRERYVLDFHTGIMMPAREERQHPDFVFKGRYAFPKAMTCGNYSTPQESPYGYGAHIIRGPIEVIKGDGILCDYDDRLQQFYPDRWKDATQKLEGQFRHTTLENVSTFLSEVYGFEVICRQIIEGCNVSSGYPYFIFISERVAPEDAA